MIKIVAGGRGSGKTKKMIDLANEMARDPHGSLFFIDDDNRNIFELDRNIRFVNKEEFKINNPELLYGFLCGILAGDYDTEKVYIDGIDYVAKQSPKVLEEYLQSLEKLGEEHEAEFILCFSLDDEHLSEYIKEKMI